MQPPSKAIPEDRSQLQSQTLVLIVGTLLVLCFLLPLPFLPKHSRSASLFLHAGVVSLTFGLVVWALRAATPAAALFGALICHTLTLWTADTRSGLVHSALIPLMLLFVLTFLTTRVAKRRRPEFISSAEARRGRTASQVIANLAFSVVVLAGGLSGLYDWISPSANRFAMLPYATPALLLAALAEATADTVSSELGQAFGGTPYLLTTLRPAPAGTDGAISVLGTAAGLLAAALVIAAGTWSMHLELRQSLAALAGGIAGLFFDSLLGATAESRGWLNNDLVNFSSTACAAATALFLLAL